jgi:hypothetical protein
LRGAASPVGSHHGRHLHQRAHSLHGSTGNGCRRQKASFNVLDANPLDDILNTTDFEG